MSNARPPTKPITVRIARLINSATPISVPSGLYKGTDPESPLPDEDPLPPPSVSPVESPNVPAGQPLKLLLTLLAPRRVDSDSQTLVHCPVASASVVPSPGILGIACVSGPPAV